MVPSNHLREVSLEKVMIDGIELALMPPVKTDDEWIDYSQIPPVASGRLADIVHRGAAITISRSMSVPRVYVHSVEALKSSRVELNS